MHYFGGHIGYVRVWHLEGGRTPDFEKSKTKFIDGLERAIGQKLAEEAGVTNEQLRLMIQLAKEVDLSNIEAVKKLYRAYNGILKRPYDEKKLFENK